MAEELDSTAGKAAADPLALHAGISGTSDEAREYMREQTRLVRLQALDLEREDKLRHWSLRVRHISDVMKLSFEFAIAVILLGLVAVIAAAVWSASHDNNLVIEAFSVPPDMAARGLTGEAVAAQLQDKVTDLQDASNSARPASSYAHSWGDDIKVQIPDTGISVSEFYRMLVAWLGHQTHISGEVFHTPTGITIIARAGSDSGTPVSGSEADFGNLVARSAEAIYAHTQPYRFAAYETQTKRILDARSIYQRLITGGETTRERAWAYLGLGNTDSLLGDVYSALAHQRKAIALIPDFALAWSNADSYAGQLGHDEEGLAAARKSLELMQAPGDIDMTPRAREITIAGEEMNIDFYLCDFAALLREAQEAENLPDYSGEVEAARENIVYALAGSHDSAAARRAANSLAPSTDLAVLAGRASNSVNVAYLLGDWQSVVALQPQVRQAYDTAVKAQTYLYTGLASIGPRQMQPDVALSLAKMGHLKTAAEAIAETPLDCTLCLRARGEIASMQKDWTRADAWFARAVAFAPSIPGSDLAWGNSLLQRGDLSAAAAKFESAHRKSPHYADPLVGWGEVLVLQNRSDLALAKFSEASQYAPNWGRLHLKWGDALHYAGHKDEAKKQFASAAVLFLTPAEKSELAMMRAKHG